MKLSRSMDHGALRVPPGLLHLNLPALPHRLIVFECRPDSATASLMSMNMGNECTIAHDSVPAAGSLPRSPAQRPNRSRLFVCTTAHHGEPLRTTAVTVMPRAVQKSCVLCQREEMTWQRHNIISMHARRRSGRRDALSVASGSVRLWRKSIDMPAILAECRRVLKPLGIL